MRVVDLRGRQLSKSEYQRLLPRAEFDIESALVAIKPILQSVKDGDETTLKELSLKFDGVAPESIRVPKSVIDQALQQLDVGLKQVILEAIRRVRVVHLDQKRGAPRLASSMVVRLKNDGFQLIELACMSQGEGRFIPAQ